MKDQLIKLHDDFVSKGMPPSNINIIFLLKNASRIHDRNIGYVLLDMQTWLREEHDIYVWLKPHPNGCRVYVLKGMTYLHKDYIIKIDYNKALLSGLQEAIKLIE